MTPAKKSGPPPKGKPRKAAAPVTGKNKGRGKSQRGSSGNTKPSQPTAAPDRPPTATR